MEFSCDDCIYFDNICPADDTGEFGFCSCFFAKVEILI